VSYTEDDAARFIYLNRAGFNGLWRVNQKGQMNVPAGDFKGDATKIMDAFDVQNLSACSIALCKAHITAGDYTDVLRTASAGDFVYLDPPYHGMYAGYTSDGFDDEDHRALAQVAKDLVARGVRVLISNSDTELVRELYTCDDFKIGTLPCMHSIAASGDKRKRVDELVIAGGGVRDWKQTELLL
jgi:DNA adenine methylase